VKEEDWTPTNAVRELGEKLNQHQHSSHVPMATTHRPVRLAYQPVELFSHNKPATSNQPAVVFSQHKPAPAISHQPTEQADYLSVFRNQCFCFRDNRMENIFR
jgi:hypothetical protein